MKMKLHGCAHWVSDEKMNEDIVVFVVVVVKTRTIRTSEWSGLLLKQQKAASSTLAAGIKNITHTKIKEVQNTLLHFKEVEVQ